MTPQCSGAGCVLPDGIAITGAAAFIVGPSAGHIYAGHTWNTGQAIRVSGIVTAGAGVLALAPCIGPDKSDGKGTPDETPCNIGIAAIVLGGLATLAGTITEIETTQAAIDDYNSAHATLTVAPIRAHDGSIAPGVALAGRF